MAELCLDCWNKLNKTRYTERNFILSKDLDLCEGCGLWRRVIIVERNCKLLYDIRALFQRQQT